jgi:hypothetical protein
MANIQFNKALVIFKIIILPVVLLPLLIEKFKGLHPVFLLVALAPILNNFDDPIRHGERCDCTRFLMTPMLMPKTLCVP